MSSTPQQQAPVPTEPASPPPAVVKTAERPHPLTPFIRGWLVLVAIGVSLLRELIPNNDTERPRLAGGISVLLFGVAVVVAVAAIAGFFTWYFTHFVIDDEELRIETGALFRNSKKVPFERIQSVDLIQPLAARIFGLAELRIEVGAGDSAIRLRYLTRRQADRFRDYLLTRAQGVTSRIGDHQGPGASILTDLGVADRPLVQVSPQRLIGAFLLSGEFLASALGLLVVLVVTVWYRVVAYALPGLIPMAIGLLTLVGNRVIAMFNFTLAESPRGLRVTRGLTNLTSQSIPLGRIQGVKLTQPILWRSLGWCRIDVNVLGISGRDSENNERSATSVLLPVADTGELTRALSRILPGVDLAAIELHRSPKNARWLRWFDFWTLRYGYSDRVLVTERGWLSYIRNLVPHAKTQSVRITQGPLQRALGLADVHVDITAGPVHATAHQIGADSARSLALGQLDRARTAREADRRHVAVAEAAADTDAGTDEVLARFGITRAALVGSGGECEVFALDHQRVLRLYRRTHEAPEQTTHQLRALYDGWVDARAGIQVPRILDAGWIGDRWSSVDRRMSGLNLSSWLARADAAERRPVLLSYLDAALAVQLLPSPVPGFARLIGHGAPERFDSLAELLTAQMLRALQTSRVRLEADVPGVVAVWDDLQSELVSRHCRPRLVHGDFCPPNVYLSRAPNGRLFISGVGDFSPHTLSADPMLDVAGAVAFLELERYRGAAADAAWLAEQTSERLGADLGHWLAVYRTYYAFYFSSAYDSDPQLYAWCLRQLDR